MIRTELSIFQLLPIDGSVRSVNVDQYIEKIKEGQPLDPIHALPFPLDTSEQYLILDGHHKIRATYELGIDTTAGLVHVTDEAMIAYIEKERRFWLPARTKEELRDLYRKEWAGYTALKGYTHIRDIPVRVPPVRRRPRMEPYPSSFGYDSY
jgi:ParB-like chromosome segregation protein Spo0J